MRFTLRRCLPIGSCRFRVLGCCRSTACRWLAHIWRSLESGLWQRSSHMPRKNNCDIMCEVWCHLLILYGVNFYFIIWYYFLSCMRVHFFTSPPTGILAHLQEALLLLRSGIVFTRPFPRASPSRGRHCRGGPGGTRTHASAISAPKSSVLPLDYPGHLLTFNQEKYNTMATMCSLVCGDGRMLPTMSQALRHARTVGGHGRWF